MYGHTTVYSHMQQFILLCQPFIAETELFMKLNSILWSTPLLPDHTHIHKHTRMQMCLLAMKKLSVLICSLRPEDKSDHGDGGYQPPTTHPFPLC